MHIFTLRILIDVAIKRDLTLYIASDDIEKAFDHVPRSLLLKKLVKIGVGKLMLFALFGDTTDRFFLLLGGANIG